MGILDVIVFVGFVIAVISIGLYKSREEDDVKDAQDYFLAGRGLTWYLVGFSLIAANISTEQFVGMTGKAADWLGMAIASYEWMAAVTLVVTAFVFLPVFLKSGIYTIPEFLEYRYNAFARTVMAISTMIILVGVPTASVIFSGAKVITGNFQGMVVAGLDLGNITVGCWIIGILAAVYVFAGGLKACAWADLIQGSALIVGGVIIAWFAMSLMGNTAPEELIQTARNDQVTVESLESAGPIQRFWDLNKGDLPEGKLHMVRPTDDPEIPWTALLVGLWIPNFFYWGLNQYITQRTLGSRSLAEGQKGVVFAAFLKLIIPFIVVIPGILAFNLFNSELRNDASGRNALLISANSPDLYQTLDSSMKPDPASDRNTLILEAIEKNLAEAEPGSKMLYAFDEEFAEMHPENSLALLQHNQSIAGSESSAEEILDGDDPAMALVIANNTTIQTATEQLGDSVGTETLIAHDYDNAFPTLIRELLPIGVGIKGFVLAAIFGAVVSSLASMLNSASTIATMDIFYKLKPNASQSQLVMVGRICTIVFVLIALLIAPFLGHPSFGGIFTFIQEFQGFISPGILAIFIFGVLFHKAPRSVGTIGLLLNPVLYGALKWMPATADITFLNRMAICFGTVLTVLALVTLIRPMKEPVTLPVNDQIDLTGSKGAKFFGGLVIVLMVALYIVFY
ncbi:sodium:solute symporter family transporter [Crateriforma conspicua]|uniref:Sodium/glucose cotransporter n=1 Tax=Crateriforma conspicua TaxID=2527996 RepID=A0A5C5YA21_9PLAN|nr:sodium/solute symporter [Crateriforma conspicua]QDV64765.1 Sodium/glucose cotransporter [Crateriforma conspicua]TWT70162.1 Sodium/glucose cotransporter [Crateriforma conspicua]